MDDEDDAASFGALERIGWFGASQASDRHPCRCGHGPLHHTGCWEPGCSFAGACRCPRYERSP